MLLRLGMGYWANVIRYVRGPAVVVLVAAVASAVNAFADGPKALYLGAALIAAAGAFWVAIEQASWEHELQATVTGGDSWCYLTLGGLTGSGNRASVTVVHQGRYPLYDVSARIVDLDKFDLIKSTVSWETLAQTETILTVGNLGPDKAMLLPTTVEIPQKGLRWNIFFSARNGFFTQELRLLQIKGCWASATRTTRRHGETEVVLREKVDSIFPRDSMGKVEW